MARIKSTDGAFYIDNGIAKIGSDGKTLIVSGGSNRVFDLNEMGVDINKSVEVDATELYQSLCDGFTTVHLSALGNEFDWNVLAIKITEKGKTFCEFSGTYLLGVKPVFVQCRVSPDKIDLEMMQLQVALSD